MHIDIHRIESITASDTVKRKLISDDKVYYTRDLKIDTGSDIVSITLYADTAAKLEIEESDPAKHKKG